MANPLEIEAAPAEETAGTTGEELSPQDARYAQEVARQINELVNSLAGLSGSEIEHLRAQLTTKAGGVEAAVKRCDPSAATRANEAAQFVTTHYATIQQEAKESKDESKEKAVKELVAHAAHALEVEQTKHVLERYSPDFAALSEEAKEHFAEKTTQFLHSTPEMAKAADLMKAIEADPEVKKKIEERQDEILNIWQKMREETQSEEMKKRLLELQQLMGDRRIPPELEDIYKRMQSGEIDEAEASRQVGALADKTRATVEAMHERALRFSNMDGELRTTLEEHFKERYGGDMSGKNLQAFIKDMEESGKLDPDNISEITAKLKANHGDYSTLTKEEQLVMAAAQLKFNVESAKTIHNLAEHLVKMPEKDRKELGDKLTKLFEAHDVDGIVKMLEQNGITEHADSREVRGFIAYNMNNLSAEDMGNVIKLKMDEIATGANHGKEIGAIYKTSYEEGQRKALEKAGLDVSGLSDEQVAKLHQNLGMNFSANLLANVYGGCEGAVPLELCPMPDEHGNPPDKTEGYSVTALLGDIGDWLWSDDAETFAALDTDIIAAPGATPQGETTSPTGKGSAIV